MVNLHIAKTWHKIFTSHLSFALAGLEAFPTKVESCHECALGRWLDSIQTGFGHSSRYQTLCSAHELFHHTIDEIFDNHGLGDVDLAVRLQAEVLEKLSQLVAVAIDEFQLEYEKQREQEFGAPHGHLVTRLDTGGQAMPISYQTGLALIDDQHRDIVGLFHKLQTLSSHDTHSEVLLDELSAIQLVFQKHFATEELMMAMEGCAPNELAAHQQGHEAILEAIADIFCDAAFGRHSSASDVFSRLLGLFMTDVIDLDNSLRIQVTSSVLAAG